MQLSFRFGCLKIVATNQGKVKQEEESDYDRQTGKAPVREISRHREAAGRVQRRSQSSFDFFYANRAFDFEGESGLRLLIRPTISFSYCCALVCFLCRALRLCF